MMEDNPYPFRFLDSLKYLVLDEFDQLLNDTILPEVKKIVSKLPSERQTLFFSATINYKIHTDDFFKGIYTNKKPEIYDLTLDNNKDYNKDKDKKEKNNEENIEEKDSNDNDNDNDNENNSNNKEESNENNLKETLKIVKNLTQNYILVPNNTKEHYLINLLLNDFKKKYLIIFVSSCKRCNFISKFLSLFNLRVSTIHSKMPQKKRFESLDDFKNKKNNILVSTDISSRGLDIMNVEIVLNYDIPRHPQDYIHRVGRTARAGNKGLAVSFVSQYDIDLIKAIEEDIETKMTEKIIEESKILEDLSLVAKAIRVTQMKIYESGFNEKLDDRKNRDNKGLKKK
jgi:ATP-dependent RNA helicase DDX49/DBP8